MERQAASYNGDTYHLIVKNCNHFCKDICYKLTGKRIPKWVNRLAKLGKFFYVYYFKKVVQSFVCIKMPTYSIFLPFNCYRLGSIFNCVLPEALKITAVQHDHKYQTYDDSEKRRLRSTFSCLSSISSRQKQLSTSSLLLQSPFKGCLPPWELKRSANGSLKERWHNIITLLKCVDGNSLISYVGLVNVFSISWSRKTCLKNKYLCSQPCE